jgi:hypothetical protein
MNCDLVHSEVRKSLMSDTHQDDAAGLPYQRVDPPSTPIHQHCLAGDKTGCIGGQKYGRADQIRWIPDARHRYGIDALLKISEVFFEIFFAALISILT